MARVVKASLYFCDWSCQNTDTRRFPFEEPTFAWLQQKLANVFQIKPEKTTVTWIDSDGDRVTISSDDELTDAIGNVEGPVLKLHVLTNRKDEEVSSKCPWAWMFQRGHHADEGGHDTTEEDDDDDHCDPHHGWDGQGCPLGFKRRGGMGNWGLFCPLRNAICPIGFGNRAPFGFGNSWCPVGFGGFRCCPMGFGSGFPGPMKGYGMYGGQGCPLGFKPGLSGFPLRNYPCPMKAMDCCPMGFKREGSGCPMRKYNCPMGFGKGKHTAKEEKPTAACKEACAQ